MNDDNIVLSDARASLLSHQLLYSPLTNFQYPESNSKYSTLFLGNDSPVGNLYKEYARITKGILLSESNDGLQISLNKKNYINIEKEKDYEQEIQHLRDQLRASRIADNHFAEEMNRLRTQLEGSRSIDQIRAKEIVYMRDVLAEKQQQIQIIKAKTDFLDTKLTQSRQAHSKTAMYALKFALHNHILHQKLQDQESRLNLIEESYQKEIDNLRLEVKSLSKDLSEAWLNVSNSKAMYVSESELNKSLSQQVVRLSILTGLAIRSSRIHSEKSLQFKDDLDDKTTCIQNFSDKLNSSPKSLEFSLVHSKSTEFSQSFDTQTFKSQNHYSLSSADSNELISLRATVKKLQNENRVLNENFFDLENSMVKGSFNTKSAIKRLQKISSLKILPKRNSKDLDKEKEEKISPTPKPQSKFRSLRSLSKS